MATLLAIWLRTSTVLSGIVVGTVARPVVGIALGTDLLGARSARAGLEVRPTPVRV